MANLIMTNWRIQDKLPYISLGSAGENNASMVTITVDALIANANYYLDIGDESGNGLPNTQELKPSTNVGTNDEEIYTLSMQPTVSWLGREGIKLLQVRCVYEDNGEEVVKESNVFHAKVDRNSGFVYKYSIAIFEEYLNKIKSIVSKISDKLSLHDLSDVNIESPTNNQVLKYDSDSQKWINGDGVSDDYVTTEELTETLQPYIKDVSIAKGNGTSNVIEGDITTNQTGASSSYAHAEGQYSLASGMCAHAEGTTIASGNFSHAQNFNTQAIGKDQTTIGSFNITQGSKASKVDTDYALIIGNGTGTNNRSNALAVQWDGNVVFQDGSKQKSSPYAIMGELGAKNLLVYPYLVSSGGYSGLTFNVNSDGSVTCNGEATAYSHINITKSSTASLHYKLPKGKYILSCQVKDISKWTTGSLGTSIYYNGVQLVENYITTTNPYRELEFEITAEISEEELEVRIMGFTGAIVNNVIIYPMIRLVNDTDNIWQPYAMTNKILTDKINSIKTIAANAVDFADFKNQIALL